MRLMLRNTLMNNHPPHYNVQEVKQVEKLRQNTINAFRRAFNNLKSEIFYGKDEYGSTKYKKYDEETFSEINFKYYE